MIDLPGAGAGREAMSGCRRPAGSARDATRDGAWWASSRPAQNTQKRFHSHAAPEASTGNRQLEIQNNKVRVQGRFVSPLPQELRLKKQIRSPKN